MDDDHTFQIDPRPFKRRKLDNVQLEDEEEEEIIDTSDVDEREYIEADGSQYWRTTHPLPQVCLPYRVRKREPLIEFRAA